MGWFSALALSLVYAAVLVGLGSLVGGWLAGVVNGALERARLDPAVRWLVVSFVRPIVVLVAVVAALESVGVRLGAVIALLAVAVATVGLSLVTTLAHAAAGSVLLTTRPFRPGDEVEVAGQRGRVVALGWFLTTIEQADGTRVSVANRLVLDAPIKTAPPPVVAPSAIVPPAAPPPSGPSE